MWWTLEVVVVEVGSWVGLDFILERKTIVLELNLEYHKSE